MGIHKLAVGVLLAIGAWGPVAPPAGWALAVGEVRPELHLQRLDGSPAPGWQDLQGKVVVIDFWASWCAPCVAAFPKLNALHERFAGEGVRFVSVTYEPARFVRDFLVEHPLTSEVAIDHDLQTFKRFDAWGIPVVYLFDRQGALAAAVHPDDLTAAMLETLLRGERLDVEPARPWPDPAGAEEHFRSHQRKLLAKYATPAGG